MKVQQQPASAGPARVAAGLLLLYKKILSPAVHSVSGVSGACRFQPTCSEYAAIAVAEYGFLRGGLMALGRLLRCHPLHRGGFDPVLAKQPHGARPKAHSHSWQ